MSLEKKAAKSREYEKAWMWREAQYKLENKLDVYDAIHVVDLLRQEIPHKEVDLVIQDHISKYKEMRGGQPEQRDV